jgi:hypothetical protein
LAPYLLILNPKIHVWHLDYLQWLFLVYPLQAQLAQALVSPDQELLLILLTLINLCPLQFSILYNKLFPQKKKPKFQSQQIH